MNYTPADMQRTAHQHAYTNVRDYIRPMTALPENPVCAMAYVPFQTELTVYDDLQALAVGTLFPCLNKPFKGSGAR